MKEALVRFNRRIKRMPHRNVLVFVHGYNTRFEEAVYRLAQIVHDSGAPTLPVLFTWPSRGKLLAYGYDRESANYSRDALEAVFKNLQDDPAVAEITVLAHSMGNWVAMEALRQMSIRYGRIAPKIRHVMLAAPDVDVDVFRRQIREIGKSRPPFTLMVSQDDRALSLSSSVWGSTARLGSIDPKAEPYRTQLKQEGLTVIDLTTEASGDKLNHGKFAESPIVVRMIGQQIAGQKLDDGHPGLGDSLGLIATRTAGAVGRATSIAIAAPVSIIDGRTREGLGEQFEDLGKQMGLPDKGGRTAPAPQ
jgi:esterase/lipase superfamily enzyme